MDKKRLDTYKRYISDLFMFMADNGYTKRPAPRITLVSREQEGDPFLWKTGYYNPDKREVTVFTANRAEKDVLRSVAHEFIHHRQNLDGRLGDGAYSGDKITQDDKLIKLEEEAYLQGNIGFRKFTETLQEKAAD